MGDHFSEKQAQLAGATSAEIYELSWCLKILDFEVSEQDDCRLGCSLSAADRGYRNFSASGKGAISKGVRNKGHCSDLEDQKLLHLKLARSSDRCGQSGELTLYLLLLHLWTIQDCSLVAPLPLEGIVGSPLLS